LEALLWQGPQKAAMREIKCSYLKENDISIKNGADEPFPIYWTVKRFKKTE